MATPASPALAQAERFRAARVLVLRSRLEATGLFAGNYRSAFRGGGLEYEESRPYAPGDDVRWLDAGATARTGVPHVKVFREERDRALLLALDVSGSMGFGTAGAAKAETAAHALALLASAAGRAGDPIGLVAFDDRVRARVPLGRGRGQSARVIRTATDAAAGSRGPTDLAAAVQALRGFTARRAVIVLISDFRDPAWQGGDPRGSPAAPLRGALAALAREHDLIAAAVVDPREQALVAAGGVRVRDAEHGDRSFVLSTGSARARRAFAAEAARWRTQLARDLRSAGAECLWLRSDRSPLSALARFFQERAGRRLEGAR
jgi:uncharacterized protein (DUF58 family)